MLKWIFDRVDGNVDAVDSPIGKLPLPEGLDLDGLEIDQADLDALLAIDSEGWKQAIPQIREHFERFGDRLPSELNEAVDQLEATL